jgi:hypothetical protein
LLLLLLLFLVLLLLAVPLHRPLVAAAQVQRADGRQERGHGGG